MHKLGVFHAYQISMCLDPHLNKGCGWRRKTGLSPPVKYFTDRSMAVLLLWIFHVFFLACVCYVFVRVCLFVLCCHLLGKGWPLGSRLWRLAVSLSLSHWYPGSGVVLDCIDSWSLHPYLLLISLKWAVTWDFYNVVYATSLTRAFTSRLNIIWLLSYWLNTIWSF